MQVPAEGRLSLDSDRRSNPRPTSGPAAQARIVEIDTSDERWQPLVESHAEGLVYHLPVWLQVLAQEYGRDPVCLACEDDEGTLQGILPLLPSAGLPFSPDVVTRRRLSSLPRTPAAGPLACDPQTARALVRAAIRRVESERRTWLELKVTSPCFDDLAPGLVRAPWRPSYVIRLDPEVPSTPSARNRARVEWAMRKAARLGVRVREAETVEDLRTWYLLYLETMRWHMLPARPFRFFNCLWDSMRPLGLMSLELAEHHEAGRPVALAGSLFFKFGNRVSCAFNGSRRESLALHPNDAIHYHAIQKARSEGFALYDLGEVSRGNAGLARFKNKWGAETWQMYRYYYPAPARDLQPRSAGRAIVRRVVERAWRRLPLSLTARLGDHVYSYM